MEPNGNPVAAVEAGAEAGAPPKEKDVPPPATPDVPPPKENAILVVYKRLVDATAGNSGQVVCFDFPARAQSEQSSNVFSAERLVETTAEPHWGVPSKRCYRMTR